jgi:hypothetical protein
MNDLQVCWWPIEKPIPYARNSRKIPQRAVDKVAASILEFGWRVNRNSLLSRSVIFPRSRLSSGLTDGQSIRKIDSQPHQFVPKPSILA